MKRSYLYVGGIWSFLFILPVLASQSDTTKDWTEEFHLKNGIVVKHTPQYVQFDDEVASRYISIPKGSEHNDYVYEKSLVLITKLSREDFVSHLIKSGLYDEEPSLDLTTIIGNKKARDSKSN